MREAISTYCRRHHLNSLVARSEGGNPHAMREAISTYCRCHHLNRLVARSAIANGHHAHSMLLDPFS